MRKAKLSVKKFHSPCVVFLYSVVRERSSAPCVVCVEPRTPAEAESDPLAAQCVVLSVWYAVCGLPCGYPVPA